MRLSFSPAPVYVRTARLVGVAVARRAGVAEELLEEIRLAIGEACSRAVALHRTYGLPDLVDVSIADRAERFTVSVVDRAANGGALQAPPTDPSVFLDDSVPPIGSGPESLSEEVMAARMGLALLAGLVDDLEVSTVGDGLGTEVRMSWPLGRAYPTA